MNSTEHTHIPADIDLAAFDQLPKSGLIDDFSNGAVNWGSRGKPGFKTFKFQDPELDTNPGNKLAITLDLKEGQELLVDLHVDGRYNTPDKEIGKFSHQRMVSGNGPQTILLETGDFKKERSKKENNKPLEWSKITTFAITLTDTQTQRKINLASAGGAGVLKRIELVKP